MPIKIKICPSGKAWNACLALRKTRNIFLLESAILCLAGTILCTIIGLLAIMLIGSIKYEHPAARMVTQFSLLIQRIFSPIVLLALLLTIIAGVYPAMRASQLDPVEALKG